MLLRRTQIHPCTLQHLPAYIESLPPCHTEIEQPLRSAHVLGVTAVEKATGSDAKKKDKKKKDKKKKDKKGRKRSSNLAAANLLSL